MLVLLQLYWSLDYNLEPVHKARSIHEFWYGIPASFTRIDAVYRREVGDTVTTIFFSGMYKH